MNKKLRAGMIGAGKMGLAHGTIINSLPNAKLISVCEPVKIINKTFREFGSHIAMYDDHIKMLEKENLDFVFTE